METPIEHTVGGDNVFADLGFAEPEEERAKAQVVIQIARVITDRKLTQAQAADILHVDQPKVSALLNGRYGGFSLDRLFRFLVALDQDIAITVTPKGRARARISVTAGDSPIPASIRA